MSNSSKRNVRRATAVLLAATVLASCSDATEPGIATHLEALSPTTLTGTVATEVTPAPTVRVSDQHGNGVGAIEIQFWTADERGIPKTVSALTDANGVATTAWILPTKAGAHRLTAVTASPLSGGGQQTSFFAVARPDAPATLVAIEGTQAATPGATLTLHARVADRFDNGIDNAPVEFAIENGGGSLAATTVYTDSTGTARTRWTVGDAGEASVVASVAGLAPVRFGAAVATPVAHYDLAPLPGGWVWKPAGSITLLDGARFETVVDGFTGNGTYSIAGSTIVFTYTNGFLAALAAVRDWWAHPFSPTVERGYITDDSITINRCFGEDCYEAAWTYRRR